MGSRINLIIGLAITASLTSCAKRNEPEFSSLVEIPFKQVKVDDRFWSPRLQSIQDTTIYDLLKIAEEQGKIDNLRILAGQKKNEKIKLFVAGDSDLWKIMEAASYSLAWKPNPRLEGVLDELIELCAEAQADDGYINMIFMRPDDEHEHRPGWNRPGFRLGYGSDERFKGSFDEWPSGLGQLYSPGHLMVAGAAYYHVRGKRNLLDIAVKMADCICREFPIGEAIEYADHPGLGIGLIKLYEVSGDARYLQQAEYYVHNGNHGRPVDLGDQENRKPIEDQRKAWGHAVCINYLYSGATDLCRYLNEPETRVALDSLWQSIIERRIYIHGGVGGPGPHEQLADDWILPPATTYSESCANIATGEWNQRMNLLYGDAKYADIMEIEAYNGALSGISLKGTEYFYTNPLSADLNNRQGHRSGVRTRYLFCCPSKLPGFVAGINRWIYARDRSGIYVNLFIGSTVNTEVGGKNISILQETAYPWEEKVSFTVLGKSPARFTLSLRIPGWARSEGPFPSELYRFGDHESIVWEVSVNGKPIEVKSLNKGYVQINRKWKPGDKVELFIPMPVRQVYSHPMVEDTRGKVALMRGPVLYCLEGIDNNFNVLSSALAPDPEIDTEYKQDLLGGVTVLNGTAVNSENEAVQFTAIPYYTWQNRGIHEMTVWMYQDIKQLEADEAENMEEQQNSNETLKELTGEIRK